MRGKSMCVSTRVFVNSASPTEGQTSVPHGGSLVALIDMPMLSLIFRNFFARDPTPVGPAAFATGFYAVLLIPVALLSLDERPIFLAALVAATFEALLLVETGAPGGTN